MQARSRNTRCYNQLPVVLPLRHLLEAVFLILPTFRFRSVPLLVLLIGLQLFTQLAAVRHGVSHLAEPLRNLGGPGHPARVLLQPKVAAQRGSVPTNPDSGQYAAHACVLCLLVHHAGLGLLPVPLHIQVPDSDFALALPAQAAPGVMTLPQPRQRGPPVFS